MMRPGFSMKSGKRLNVPCKNCLLRMSVKRNTISRSNNSRQKSRSENWITTLTKWQELMISWNSSASSELQFSSYHAELMNSLPRRRTPRTKSQCWLKNFRTLTRLKRILTSTCCNKMTSGTASGKGLKSWSLRHRTILITLHKCLRTYPLRPRWLSL